MTSALQNREKIDKTLPPWVSSPYSLVTWWDMEKFSAAAFYDFGTRLTTGRLNAQLTADASISKSEWKKVEGYKTLKRLKRQCNSIGLRLSSMTIRDFLKNTKEEITAKEIIRFLGEIENTIRREMSIVHFFYMPSKQAEFYRQEELFGRKVNAKFPTIQYDMVEAGNCMAMGRSTACVFHLMRIMEVGVQEFGKKLGVSLTGEKVWNTILEQTDKALKALPKSPAKVEMCEVSTNLYAVRVAWRNEVMHPNDKYTLEEAKNLIGQVKLFMGQLATIL